MSRKTVKMVAFIIIIAMVVTSFSFLLFLPAASYGAESAGPATTAQEQKYLNDKMKELENYVKLVRATYMDDVDYETLMDGAFEGVIFALGDPYSVFFTDPDDGEAFVESATGEYVGVGVTMSESAAGTFEVNSVHPKGPADKAGVKTGDTITAVDGQSTAGKDLNDMGKMLRGEEGTEVEVTVSRDGKEHTYRITRAKIVMTNVRSEMMEGSIGYLKLSGFAAKDAAEFIKAKGELMKAGAESLIIDVRDNPGGLMSAAYDIACEFVGEGIIAHHVRKGELLYTMRSSKKEVKKVPTVLLINEYSASASEMLAGALKDNDAAILVGTTTYGKGCSQILANTNAKRQYKISESYFLTPNMNEINGVGIAPHHLVRNSLGDFREEAAELYMQFAPFAESTKPVRGDTGLNVFAAQQRLALLGFSTSLTATMDDATVAAVKRFQREQGLYAGGTLDNTTQSRIDEVTMAYIANDSDEDMQLMKAVELLKKN